MADRESRLVKQKNIQGRRVDLATTIFMLRRMDGCDSNFTVGPALMHQSRLLPDLPARGRASSLVRTLQLCLVSAYNLCLREELGITPNILRATAMAEICLGVAIGEGETGETERCEKSSQTARRRRIEIRRMRCVAGVESMGKPLGVDLSRKRQRSDLPVHSRIAHQKNNSGEMKRAAAAVDGRKPDPVIAASFIGSVVSEKFPRYGIKSVCGLRRDMEDAVSIRPEFLRRRDRDSEIRHFFGVFDGHGCSHVASWCKDRLHEVVAEEVESEPPAIDWKRVMNRSFSRMDEEVMGWAVVGPRSPSCRCELQTPKCDHVGSTAVVAVVEADRIVVANCGDSRAVLCRKGAAVPLSIDHKPDRPDELKRIEGAGGRVIFWDGPRVLGVLAMSRAIGDGYLKPYVTAEPEVTVTERKEMEDECLILASDGLWDVVANETACEVVRMCLQNSGRGRDVAGGMDKACSDAATLLTKLALARNSADNVSVVVVDLRRNPL